MENLNFQITAEQAGERIDKVLADHLPEMSRVQIQKLIKEGAAFVNGKSAKPALRLDEGDTLEVTVPDLETVSEIQPENLPLEVIYEDAHLAAINKPAGLVVHPGVGNEEGTLVNALLARWPQVGTFGDRERAGIVHRLDKDTSGIILVALTEEAQTGLMAQFQDREVGKIYWGLVEGKPRTETGRIEAPIGRAPQQRKKMAVIKTGKAAVTEFRTLQSFEAHSLLEFKLETGRTHQIRVHAAYISCPIVGDTVYGFRKQKIKLSRLFLHAKAITFTHPITGQVISLETELPQKLQNVLNSLE
jgi:23S rRNA pseudouridine1911/1915/1917 synthase